MYRTKINNHKSKKRNLSFCETILVYYCGFYEKITLFYYIFYHTKFSPQLNFPVFQKKGISHQLLRISSFFGHFFATKYPGFFCLLVFVFPSRH